MIALGLLLGNQHLSLGAQELLFSDLLLLNGGAILLGNLQAGEIQSLHGDIAKFTQLIGNLLLHLLRDGVPLGGNRNQLILGEDRFQGLQQGGLDHPGIDLLVVGGDRFIDPARLLRLHRILHRGGGLNHLQILGECGKLLRPDLGSYVE